MSGLIYVPKREIIVPIKAALGMRGRYKIEAVNMTDGRRRVLADWFPNLITTNGADLLGGGNPLTYCSVGSGNRAPALTDTALQSLIATTGTNGPLGIQYGNPGSAPWYGSTTVQYAFAQGAATGNLSEVGVGAGNTGLNLFSRALILDGGGSPTTITVLSTEALYVTYQLNQYSPSADVTGNITIAGVVYAYTLRASLASSTNWAYRNGDAGGVEQVTIYNGAIGTVTGSPSGTQATSTGIVNNSYSTGSFTLSGTASFGLTTGNFGGNGVTAAQVYFGTFQGTRGAYQVSFNAGGGVGIPKDGSHNLTLSFSTSWVINSP